MCFPVLEVVETVLLGLDVFCVGRLSIIVLVVIKGYLWVVIKRYVWDIWVVIKRQSYCGMIDFGTFDEKLV